MSNIGIKPICPLSREEFDRTKHVCSERDMIWISEDQENRNETIHSVVKPGILDVNSSKVVKPAYVRKYVFHSGAGNIQAKSPKSETPHKVTDTSADDELRAAAE